MSLSSQYNSLFSKFSILVVFTNSAAPFATGVTPPMSKVASELLKFAVPLLTEQEITPFPLEAVICRKSVMGKL